MEASSEIEQPNREGLRWVALCLVLALVLLSGLTELAPGGEPKVVCVREAPATPSSGRCEVRSDFVGIARFRPKRLPDEKMAPIDFSLTGAFRYPEAPLRRGLDEMVVELDENGTVDAVGLPACGKAMLMALDTVRARRGCREAIVGSGTAQVSIEGQSPDPTALPLTLFNGGIRNGITTLLIHSSTPRSVGRPLVAVVKIEKIRYGHYGLRAVSKIPRIADGRGLLLGFRLTVDRGERGADRHYALARCSDGRLQARVLSVFEDRTRIQGTFLRPCEPTKVKTGDSLP